MCWLLQANAVYTLANTTNFPALAQQRNIAAEDVMSEVLGLWKRQTPNLSADRCAHIMEMSETEVFRKQTCQQSLLSFGEICHSAFFYFSLNVWGENVLACVIVQRSTSFHQDVPDVPVLVYTDQEEQGMNGKLVPPKDSAGAPLVWDTCGQLQRVHIYFFTCTGTTAQQPSTIKTMEEKGDQISFLFEKWIKLNSIYFFLKVTQGCLPKAIKEQLSHEKKPKKLYQISATLCFIKQFQIEDSLWKEPNKVLPVCLFFLPDMPLAFILKTEYICLHSERTENTWSSFMVLAQLLCWYEKMSKSTR